LDFVDKNWKILKSDGNAPEKLSESGDSSNPVADHIPRSGLIVTWPTTVARMPNLTRNGWGGYGLTTPFVDKPAGKLVLVNAGVALGLFVAFRRGYRGLDLFFLSIVSIVLLNAVAAISILIGRRIAPSYPNKFLKPLWIVVGVLWLVYLLDYTFPAK
jgi:hypothetical protein